MPRAIFAGFTALFLASFPNMLMAQVPGQLPGQAVAQNHVTLGYGRILSNDALGDGKDRWRTGSVAVSMIRGLGWNGALPSKIGDLLEYRVRAEVIAPANGAIPSPKDRRYVGALSAGVHAHFARAATELRLGADIVGIGPQTGVGSLHRQLHKTFGMTPPSNLATQLPNHIYPTFSAELGKTYSFGNTHLRPFVEAQAGVESYVRIGGDLVFGSFGQGAMMLRDQVTGQRFVGVSGAVVQGLSATIGGDIAQVYNSAYLPKSGPIALRTDRSRLRAGVNWRGEKSDVFYGLTHLGREFKGQTSGQTLGSLRLHIRF